MFSKDYVPRLWRQQQWGSLKNDMAIALILLVKELSPSFFVVVTHLLVYLVKELQLCNLDHTWWMYLSLEEKHLILTSLCN
jgi:hypothetical protein